MAVGEFYVEHQMWARFPKVVHVCRKRGCGGIERKRYVPERTCQNRDAEIYPGGMVFVCSACESMSTDGQPNYCPSCGAKVIDNKEE